MVISNSGNTVLTVQQLPVLRLFPFSTDSTLHSEKKLGWLGKWVLNHLFPQVSGAAGFKCLVTLF